ncbi:enoyl-CoA hydratase/isomerase family protein [Mycobacterium sp. MMS18-G62]
MTKAEALDLVTYEVDNQVAWVTLNRPSAMNALSMGLMSQLGDAFAQVAHDDGVLAVVITGAGGRAFSTGADLKEVAAAQAAQAAAGGPASDMGGWGRGASGGGFRAVGRCVKPVIAAIDGYCIAGGLELALTCDIRIATRQSVFGLPEARRSLIAGPGTIELPRLIPRAEALKIAITGTPITAQRAYEIGLIQELAEDRDELMNIARSMTADITLGAPLAVRDIKRLVRAAPELSVEQAGGLREVLTRQLAQTADAKEGPRAFAEKRLPKWTNS